MTEGVIDPHPTDRPIDFHILALSGGGFRGLYTATVLKHLEESFGSPLAAHFDLICGTSAGGLLALGLAAEIPATELQMMFERDGKRIFGTRSLLRRLLTKFFIAKHSPTGLRDVLEERFKDGTVGDLKHRVLIPTVNYSSGKGQFFKTPHAPKYEMDHHRRLVDVGLATAAAPYFRCTDRRRRRVRRWWPRGKFARLVWRARTRQILNVPHAARFGCCL